MGFQSNNVTLLDRYIDHGEQLTLCRPMLRQGGPKESIRVGDGVRTAPTLRPEACQTKMDVNEHNTLW